jgi:hypothetical protein
MGFELPFKIGIPIMGCLRRTVGDLMAIRVNLGLASTRAEENFKVIRHNLISAKHVRDAYRRIHSGGMSIDEFLAKNFSACASHCLAITSQLNNRRYRPVKAAASRSGWLLAIKIYRS